MLRNLVRKRKHNVEQKIRFHICFLWIIDGRSYDSELYDPDDCIQKKDLHFKEVILFLCTLGIDKNEI